MALNQVIPRRTWMLEQLKLDLLTSTITETELFLQKDIQKFCLSTLQFCKVTLLELSHLD